MKCKDLISVLGKHFRDPKIDLIYLCKICLKTLSKLKSKQQMHTWILRTHRQGSN